MHVVRVVGILVAVGLAAGCAGPSLRGQVALRQGHYAEAAGRFEEALAREPGSLTPLIGLGVSRYKLGDMPGAIAALEDAAARAPADPSPRLYLALARVRAGDVARAREDLEALRGLPLEPRLAFAVDRTIALLRGAPLGDEVRAYVASMIEDQADWAIDVREARLALQHLELRRLADERFLVLCRCR
jgi:tetratricopeptide (TPR) repeat protein